MAEELKPALCVVGGGPAGLACALAATAEGASVVLIEKAALGGTNLASGSVPAQALLSAAMVSESLRRGPTMGVSAAPLNVNLAKVREHIVAVSAAAAAAVSAERLTALGVRVVAGEARFTDHNTVVAGDLTIRARNFVLAVGSVPEKPAFPGLEGIEEMSFAEAFSLGRKPSHLIILGATRCGFELAQACSRLGIDASIVDPGEALAGDDPELSAIVIDRLRAEGVRIRTGVRIDSISRRRGGVRIVVAEPGQGEVAVDGSHLLVATGRTPAIEGLSLEAAGVGHDKDGIVVDRRLRTANRRIYAIGDAIAGPARVARAEYQAAEVVRGILGGGRPRYGQGAVPLVTYTDPGLATVGLTEADARRVHGAVRVLRFPFVENDLASAERLPEGVVKVVATNGGRILGVGIVGRGAAELVAPWALAMANRLPLAAMRHSPVSFPSRSEVSRRLAASAATPRLTLPWRHRIIAAFRKRG